MSGHGAANLYYQLVMILLLQRGRALTRGGASNNAAFDGNSSFMNVIYYFSPTAAWTETKMITASDSNNVYGNCSKDFEFKKALTPIQSGLREVVCSFTLI